MCSRKTIFTAHNKQLKQQEIQFSSLKTLFLHKHTHTHKQTPYRNHRNQKIRLSKTTLDCIRKSCSYGNNRLLFQTVQSVYTSVCTTYAHQTFQRHTPVCLCLWNVYISLNQLNALNFFFTEYHRPI